MRGKAKPIDLAGNTSSGKGQKLLSFSLSNNGKNWPSILRPKEIIDKTTSMIFNSYKKELLSEPITYIISAVWGKIKQGTLTANQEEIYETISSMVENIMGILELDELNEAQIFAIEYFIRGLVISKITYLIEAFKNRSNTAIKLSHDNTNPLNNL